MATKSTLTADQLKNKKITMATLKSFINKAEVLYVEHKRAFDGMIDGERECEPGLKPVSKEKAIGFEGVYCVGSSRDYFTFVDKGDLFGINVYNSCGSATLWTKG